MRDYIGYIFNYTRIKRVIFHPIYAFRRLRYERAKRLSYRRFMYECAKRLYKDKPVKLDLEDLNFHLFVRLSDVGISRELYLTKAHEKEASTIFKSYLKPGQTIIDVGANIGYYPILEAVNISPGGRIFAIEPGPESYELLKYNTTSNGYEDVISTYNLAIGDVRGKATLYISSQSNLNSMLNDPLFKSYAPIVGSVQVDMITLDDFISQNNILSDKIDIVRMDVEGYELKIFKGMTKLLENSQRLRIFFEIHPKIIKTHYGFDSYQDFLKMLDGYGFKIDNCLPRAEAPQLNKLNKISTFEDLIKFNDTLLLFISK